MTQYIKDLKIEKDGDIADYLPIMLREIFVIKWNPSTALLT